MSKSDTNVQRTSIKPFGVFQSEGAEELGLTIYQAGGMAVVRELRRMQLSAGSNQVYLEGMPTQYQPNSLVVVTYEGEGELSLGPVSYRAANLDKARILAGTIGKKVTIKDTLNNGRVANVNGILRAVLGNELAVERSDNHRVVIVPSDQVELECLPAGLSSTPSLMMLPTASEEGSYVVGLMYEAGGLAWSSRYFAFYDEKANKLTRLEASVAITNRSGARFHNALVQLLAAANYAQADAFAYAESVPMGGARAALAAPKRVSARKANVQSVGEVKMYPLPERVTIADGETQQVTLFLANDVPVTREYFLSAGDYHNAPGEDAQKLPVFVRLRLENTEANNLGAALPDGEVCILQPDADGNPQKTFTAALDAVAQGESFKLEFGPSADIKAERVLLSATEDEEGEEEAGEGETEPHFPIKPLGGPGMPGDRARDIAREVITGGGAKQTQPEDEDAEAPRFRTEVRQLTVHNYKGEAVAVHVAEYIPQDAEILAEPEGYALNTDGVNGANLVVDVPANGKVTLEYSLRWQLN
jgi:hypothetical protein